MLRSWQFWTVMAAIGALTGLFAFAFTTDPKIVPSPLVGRPALAFALTELNSGERLGLADLKGTPFLLNFWASWCVACRDEARLLEAAHRRWGASAERFRVIGIAVQDTPDAARKFARRFGKTYFLALDTAEGDISLNYGLYGVPESFFVGADGVVRHKQIGALTAEVIENQVTGMLNSAKATQ